MATAPAPYWPIVYVRGYAMTPAEIADAVSSPYMGFNVGATKLRQAWDGQVRRHVFESPLVRLMKDCGYRDIYTDGMKDAPLYERDTFNLDRVEVLKGSASMLFGKGSTGGVVNQVNKAPLLIDQQEVCSLYTSPSPRDKRQPRMPSSA